MPIYSIHSFHIKKWTSLTIEVVMHLIDNCYVEFSSRSMLWKMKTLARMMLKAELLASFIYLGVVLINSIPYYVESTIGETLCREGKLDAAEPHLERALGYSKTWSCADKRRIRAFSNMAVLNHRRGNLESAEFYALCAVESSSITYPNSVEYLLSISNLAAVYRDSGEYQKAERYFKQALSLCDSLSRKYPTERWRKVDIVTNLAKMHLKQRKYAQTRKELNCLLTAFTENAGENDIALGTVYEGLGKVYFAESRFEEAKHFYQEVLVLDENYSGHNSSVVSNDYDNLGEVFLASGHLASAEECFWIATGIRVGIYGKEHPLMSLCNYNMARIRFKQMRFAEALWLAQHALRFEGPNGRPRIEQLIADCKLAVSRGAILSVSAARG